MADGELELMEGELIELELVEGEPDGYCDPVTGICVVPAAEDSAGSAVPAEAPAGTAGDN
jgi:hypothetical protein